MDAKLESETPLAPWVEFPDSEPTWAGWRQGVSESWLHEIWLPYWRSLSPTEREMFLGGNPPPSEDWRFYLEHVWAR